MNEANATRADVLTGTYEVLPAAFLGAGSGVCQIGVDMAYYAIVSDRATGARVLAVLLRQKKASASELRLPTSMDVIEQVLRIAQDRNPSIVFEGPKCLFDNHNLVRQRP